MESDRVSTIIDFAELQRRCHFPFGVVLFSTTVVSWTCSTVRETKVLYQLDGGEGK